MSCIGALKLLPPAAGYSLYSTGVFTLYTDRVCPLTRVSINRDEPLTWNGIYSEKPVRPRNCLGASLTVLRSPKSEDLPSLISHLPILEMISSSSLSFSPIASFRAAADLLGKTAGEMVNRTSKDDAASTRLVERGAEGSMDVIAYDVDIKERACFMSCLSLAFGRVRWSCIGGGQVSHLPRRRVSLRRTQHERERSSHAEGMRFMRSDICCWARDLVHRTEHQHDTEQTIDVPPRSVRRTTPLVSAEISLLYLR